jgi:Ca-activated chloride channel homolog
LNSEWFMRFASLQYLYFLLPAVVLVVWLRRLTIKPVIYRYALGDALRVGQMTNTRWRQYSMYALRLASLVILALLVARPQLVDLKSQIKSEGIDIVLVLDVSATMQTNDFDDNRMRIDVAKEEAIHFVERRHNDAIGLVLFARDALSRVPLTLDKQLLRSILKDIQIGDIPADGTVLATGMVAAANRLKQSKGKSKIMVVLTDGEPAGEDLDPSVAIEVAKQYGIKIYTVGIGSARPRVMHDFFGRQFVIQIDIKLLEHIAQQTGGKFFMVTDARDMRSMYDTIDTLETSSLEVPLFSRLYDMYVGYTLLVLFLIMLELFLSSVIWFGI